MFLAIAIALTFAGKGSDRDDGPGLHVAGALELPDAVRVVFHRARIMQEATDLGRMAQVSLDEKAAARIPSPA